MNMEQVLRSPRSKGKAELIAHLKGKRLTFKRAILAKCFECMGGYIDGCVDCNIPNCPNYPYMPYRESRTPQNPLSPAIV